MTEPNDNDAILLEQARRYVVAGERIRSVQTLELAAGGRLALTHRVSHCLVAPGGGHNLRYILVPELPRRMLDPWTGRLGGVARGDLPGSVPVG